MMVLFHDYFNDFDIKYGKYNDKTKDSFYLNCVIKTNKNYLNKKSK